MINKFLQLPKFYFFLLGIILLAISIRFLYFPQNILFDYDSARDSFISLDVLQGNIKLIGPPSWIDPRIHHGPLIYYTLAPIYLIFQKNPEAVAAFLRIFNSLGVVLTFLIATIMFNKRIGLIAGLLFAVSFEQSQYSLFFGHPGLAVIPVLIFYLGLSWYIFLKKQLGLIISLVGLGVAIQYHYANSLLILVFLLALFIYRKSVYLSFKYFSSALATFLLTISTFIIAEIKFSFPITSSVITKINSLSQVNQSQPFNINHIVFVINRFIHDNLIAWENAYPWVLIILIITSIASLLKIKEQPKILFLLLWFAGGLLPHFLVSSTSYYYNPGASVSLLIFTAYLIYQLLPKWHFVSLILFTVIIFSNLTTTINFNRQGPNKDIVIQPGMLLSDEKQIIDYIYEKAENKPFAVSALTIPFNINTTWSYLFEWYGKNKYGYLPIWIGPTALGYPGNLSVATDRGKLPQKQFLIIEPTIGIREGLKQDFFQEEGYFTNIIEEKRFGTLTVQSRQPY